MPQKKRKRPLFTPLDAAKEQELLGVLFGNSESNFDSDSDEDNLTPSLDETVASSREKIVTTETLKPAWEDEDDESVLKDVTTPQQKKLRKSYSEVSISGDEYAARLREQFEKINSAPTWSSIIDSGLKISASTKKTVEMKGLNGNFLNIMRLKDATIQTQHRSVVQGLQCHPSKHIILSCGLDRSLNLYQIDNQANECVQRVNFKDLPIHSAFFLGSDQIVCTGRRKHFYSYDIVSGRVTKIPNIRGSTQKSLENAVGSTDGKWIAVLGTSGRTTLLDGKSKHPIHTLKMNGVCSAACFDQANHSLLTSGDTGEVYIWDIRSGRCRHKFVDEGSMCTSALNVSPCGGYFAVGSRNGVVNLYDSESAGSSKRPTPLKSFMHITTAVSTIHFNFDSQILAFSSYHNKSSLKMVHVSSQSVFPNWPAQKTPLGRVSCFCFSPNGGYMPIGNDKGQILMYKLRAYSTW